MSFALWRDYFFPTGLFKNRAIKKSLVTVTQSKISPFNFVTLSGIFPHTSPCRGGMCVIASDTTPTITFSPCSLIQIGAPESPSQSPQNINMTQTIKLFLCPYILFPYIQIMNSYIPTMKMPRNFVLMFYFGVLESKYFFLFI